MGVDLKVDVSLGAMIVGGAMHASGSLGKYLHVKDFGVIKPQWWDFGKLPSKPWLGDPEWTEGDSRE